MRLYIGDTIKKLRADKNVTQDTLAEYLGVTYQAVSRWETGMAYPDIELLPEIAKFFEVSIDELMGIEYNPEKIDETINYCLNLRETDKAAALDKLREMERKYPNNWKIKSRICHTLIYPKPNNYEDVLPELRIYAEEAKDHCRMKDINEFQFIANVMLRTVPEEEIDMWKEYLPVYHIPNYYLTMINRYRERNDNTKVIHFTSKLLLDYLGMMIYILSMFESDSEQVFSSRKYIIRLIDAVVGIPYAENGILHNTILLEDRARYLVQLAVACIALGRIDEGLDNFERSVDLYLMYVESLNCDSFTSDSCYIEDEKNSRNTAEYKIGLVELWLETLSNEFDWLDPVRDNKRFKLQLQRLIDKKTELY